MAVSSSAPTASPWKPSSSPSTSGRRCVGCHRVGDARSHPAPRCPFDCAPSKAGQQWQSVLDRGRVRCAAGSDGGDVPASRGLSWSCRRVHWRQRVTGKPHAAGSTHDEGLYMPSRCCSMRPPQMRNSPSVAALLGVSAEVQGGRCSSDSAAATKERRCSVPVAPSGPLTVRTRGTLPP